MCEGGTFEGQICAEKICSSNGDNKTMSLLPLTKETNIIDNKTISLLLLTKETKIIIAKNAFKSFVFMVYLVFQHVLLAQLIPLSYQA